MSLRRTPLKRQSEKKKISEAQLKVTGEQRRRMAGGMCEGQTPACPPRIHAGRHNHHVRLRSQGGSNEVENLRYLCADAHSWIHANPAEAAVRGLIAPRWKN